MMHGSSTEVASSASLAAAAFPMDERFMMQLKADVQSQIDALRAQQQLAQSPVQIVVDNTSTVHACQTYHQQEPRIDDTSNTERWWHDMLLSPGNRFALFAMAHVSLCFAQSYLSHRYRMSELQQRIDANAFLRFQQVLSNQLKHLV
jgi:hypothetical protein